MNIKSIYEPFIGHQNSPKIGTLGSLLILNLQAKREKTQIKTVLDPCYKLLSFFDTYMQPCFELQKSPWIFKKHNQASP